MEEKNWLVRENLNNITRASDDILNNLLNQMKDKKLNAGGEIGGLLYSFKAMASIGNPNSVSDAGVGALCARSAVMGAYMNVRINAASYNDKSYVADIVARGKEIERKAIAMEAEILSIVNEKIGV